MPSKHAQRVQAVREEWTFASSPVTSSPSIQIFSSSRWASQISCFSDPRPIASPIAAVDSVDFVLLFEPRPVLRAAASGALRGLHTSSPPRRMPHADRPVRFPAMVLRRPRTWLEQRGPCARRLGCPDAAAPDPARDRPTEVGEAVAEQVVGDDQRRNGRILTK